MTVHWGSVGPGLVTVVETTAYGCVAETEICIDIIESPTALFTTFPEAISDTIHVCLQDSNLSLPVNFFDASFGSYDSPIESWSWNFGDGSTSSDQFPPAHNFPGPGIYEVWLVVENACNCKDSMKVVVDVSNSLGPDISCASTVCEGATETYSTSAVCTTYNWSVIGGTINDTPPYGSTISITWGTSTPGVVLLDVSGCDSSYCTWPTTALIPIIPATSTVNGPDIVCSGAFETYAVSYLPGCTYSWSVTGGGTIIGSSTDDEVTIFWSGSGGTVSVSYDNPELDCSGSAELIVQVKPEYGVSGPADVCEGTSANYIATVGTFNWSVVDGAGTIIQTSLGTNNINVNWTTAGTYQVIATDVSSAYCNSPQAVFVTVHASPPAPTFITGPDSICAGLTYSYSSSPTSASYYLDWAVTGGTPTSGTGNDITITWGLTPPYVIDLYQVSVANPSCSSAVFSKTINLSTLGSISISGVDTTCANIVENYAASSVLADDYNWSISPAIAGSVIDGQGTPFIEVQWNNYMGPAVITLVAYSCNDSLTVTKNIVLTLPPDPVIVSLDSACQGDPFVFSTTTSGDAYAWNFGDGNTATTASTDNEYLTAGNYLVTLTVTNPGGCVGTSTVTKFVKVNEAPTANLTTPDSTKYCNGFPISTTMYINIQPGNTYVWNGPGGATGFTGTSWTTNVAGNFYVMVTNIYGCQTKSNTIKVRQIPCTPGGCVLDPGAVLDFNFSVSCNTVNFFENIVNGNLVSWKFDDPGSGSNYSNASNPTHTFDEAGYYNVELKGKFPGTPDSCIIEEIKTVIIPAVAHFDWNIIGCTGTGFEVDFFDRSDVVTPYTINWNWTFGGGVPAASTAQDPAGVILSPGSHIVTLTINSSGGTTCTIQDTIVIPNFPVASFTAADTVCDGNPVVFTNTSGAGINNLLWKFGDGASSLLDPITDRTYSGPGTYIATLIVTDTVNCTDSVSKSILVIPNTLSVAVTPGGPTTFCQGDSVQLTASASGGSSPYDYLWSNLETTTTIAASQSGDYTVTAEDGDGCLATSDPVSVIVNPIPTAVILGESDYCYGELVELTANQGPSNSYEWIVDGSSLGTTADYSFTIPFSPPPSYEVVVVVTAPNGCFDTSDVFTIYTHPFPAAATITPSATLLCSGTPITLTATAGYDHYVWNTGETSEAIVVTAGGLYTVTVYNEFGCGTPTSIFITSMPDFSNLMVGCYSFCDTADVLWVGPTGAGYTYQWLYNFSPIAGATSANYLIPADSSGIYQLVIDNSGCIDTSNYIDISFYPCADSCEGVAFIKTITCDSIVDGNQTYNVDVGFTNPFSPAATYTITTPNGTLTGGLPVSLVSGYNWFTTTYTELIPGDTLCIQIVITDTSGARCITDICKVIPPCDEVPCEFELDYNFAYSEESPCEVFFTANPTIPAGLTIVSYFWDFGDATTSSLANPSHYFPGSGTYNVCLTVLVTNGVDTCSLTVCKQIHIHHCEPQPCSINAEFNYVFNDPCTITFTATTVPPPGVTITGYSWSFGDGFTGTGSPVTHSYGASGVYTVCLTVYATNGFVSCYDTYCFEVKIKGCKPGPCKVTANYSFTGSTSDPCTVDFTDLSFASMGYNVIGWQWDFGDGSPLLTGVQHPSHTFPGSGTYVVCLTAQATGPMMSCINKICMEVTIKGCFQNQKLKQQKTLKGQTQTMEVWPNPSNGKFYLKVQPEDFNAENIRVFNSIGKEVQYVIGSEGGQPYLELKTNEKGVYLLILQKGGVLIKTSLIKH